MKDSSAATWSQLFRDMRAMHICVHAAHTCYFIVLSVFPTLVLMFGLLRYTALLPEDLLDLISGLLPDALLPILWDLTALWSAGRGVYALQAGLNAAYGLQEQRSWLHKRLLCMAYTFLLILVLLLTLVLHVFGNTTLLFLQQKYRFWAWVDFAALRFFLPVLMQTLLFCAMFMYLPGKRHGFRESLPGALFGSFGWMSASGVFSLYVAYFPRYANIFGSVYGVALAGFWLYICISIVFYGAVLNRILKNIG